MATFIKGMSQLALKHRRIEIGQVAVAASAALGSINGSTAANTATTGTFTIPLMKENGYPPRVAAAIESVASCGGQILPPIMGAGAFLMAELIDPTYSEIIVAATLPAALFFLTVGFGVSLNTPRSDMGMAIDGDYTVFDQLLNAVQSVEYISMFIVLLYYLIIIQSDPMLAGFYSIITLAGVRLLRNLYEGVSQDDATVGSKLRRFSRDTLEGMRRGVEATVNITIILASLGIVVRALIVTGFAQQLSTQMILLASGDLLILLGLAMAASIVFGMGMSTTAAYTLVATLVAPALTNTGFDPLLGHFFVFYFAIVSNITPPIALSIVIAQGIAGSSFTETTVSAMKIGFPMLLLPYAFALNPSLLNLGPTSLLAFVVVLVGFAAIAAGAAGRVSEELSPPVRVAFIVLGLTTVFAPMVLAQLALAVIALGGILYFTADAGELFGATASRFS
jgi:TRAP transporter 4TM/12TM fusion protein